MERHADLVARSLLSPLCSHRVVGKTLDGQDLDLLRFSSSEEGAAEEELLGHRQTTPGRIYGRVVDGRLHRASFGREQCRE